MSLTGIVLMAEASRVLGKNGYRVFQSPEDQVGTSRLFEDPFGIVQVSVFETWGDLLSGWAESQSNLVATISSTVAKSEPKAWEGYLVLLTPATPEKGEEEYIREIRTNLTRVRKLVATGLELQSLADVERTLLPLLPIDVGSPHAAPDALAMIAELLKSKRVDAETAEDLLKSFEQGRPLLESLRRGVE